MKKKSFVYGAIILGLASILCKLIGAIFRIPLTNLIGIEGLGVYQLVYPIFALCLVASSSGVAIAISKIISREFTNKNYQNIKKIFKNALIIMVALGVFFSVLIIALSFPISKLQGNNDLYICYFALAPSILLGSIISCYKGYFQGFEIMKFTAISQIIEQLFKLVFGLFFAYIFMQYGMVFGVVGVFVGIFISEFITLLFLLIAKKAKNLNINFLENSTEVLTNKQALKLIIKESVPITLTSMIIPLTSVIDSLLIIKLLSLNGFNFGISSSLYGLDSGVVASLINLPSVIAVSISASLMPAISSSYALKNDKDISFKSKLAIKIVWYFTLPCVINFFFLSKEICYFLYGNFNSQAFNQLLVAGTMLKLSSFSIIYIALNQVLTTIMQAINESYYSFYVLLFASIIKIILTIILVSTKLFNIYGLVVSDVVSYAIASVLNLTKSKQKINIKFSFYEILFVPLFSLIIMTTSIIIFKIFFLQSLSRLLILVCAVISFILYLMCVIILKGFNQSEIKNTKILNFIKHKKY